MQPPAYPYNHLIMSALVFACDQHLYTYVTTNHLSILVFACEYLFGSQGNTSKKPWRGTSISLVGAGIAVRGIGWVRNKGMYLPASRWW